MFVLNSLLFLYVLHLVRNSFKLPDEKSMKQLLMTVVLLCRETDIEEVLALQTRLHNSAGMFLDSARRGGAAATSTRRPRTPNTSPHGSPRRGRKSPALYGNYCYFSTS